MSVIWMATGDHVGYQGETGVDARTTIEEGNDQTDYQLELCDF